MIGFLFIILLVTLFIFGLQIPTVSIVLLLIFFAMVLSRGLVKGKLFILNQGFLLSISILLCFALLYYFTLYIYHFIDFGDVIKNILLIFCSYGIGYSIKSSEIPGRWYGLYYVLLSMVAGFVFFALLSVKEIVSTASTLVIIGRAVPNFWTGGDPVNTTVFGLLSSLGLCMASIIFFGKEKTLSKISYFVVTIPVVLLFIVGGYINIILKNRSPYIALALSLIIAMIIFFFIKKETFKYKITRIFVIGLILGIFAFSLSDEVYDFLLNTVLIRFTKAGVILGDIGLKTGRYKAWGFMLENLFTYPLGGREAYIGGLSYVHNLWLDVAYNAGIIPLIFLLLFHTIHYKKIFDIVRSKLPLFVIISITAISTSITIGFMVEPVLDASITYFSMTCIFFGLIKRLSTERIISRNEKVYSSRN